MSRERRPDLTLAVIHVRGVDPDGAKELGVYVSPSEAGLRRGGAGLGDEAQFDAGFEAVLIPEVKQWLADRWPSGRVAGSAAR